MKIKDILIVYHEPTKSVLTALEKFLEKRAECVCCERTGLDEYLFRKKDLVIVIGGDGTFLRASHFVKDELIFGINPEPEKKEGFFTRAVKKDFMEKLERILDGRFKVTKLLRLEARINGKKVPALALNEFFIGSHRAYITLRYKLRIGRKEEEEKSSGIIVSTPAGSTAWNRSAGGGLLRFNDLERYQYIIREPYFGRVHKPKMLHGILDKKLPIRITSEGKGVLVTDSFLEYPLKENALVEIRVSEQHLNFVDI